MILSMTGYGSAEHVENGLSYVLGIRSVNNRYLKLSVKLPERLQSLEADVEKQLRERLARGTISYTLRVRSESGTDFGGFDVAALQKYVDRLGHVRMPAGVQATIDLAALVELLAVGDALEPDEETRKRELKTVSDLTARALTALIEMRREEGQALRRDLHESCGAIRQLLKAVAARAPSVVEEYHERLRSRVAQLMAMGKFELEADALAREVAIYAERCDIHEELSRLGSHLDQFEQVCDRGEQAGRTLDFLTQELLREANTIASKSNDALITRNVVEIKGRIDRLKEQEIGRAHV